MVRAAGCRLRLEAKVRAHCYNDGHADLASRVRFKQEWVLRRALADVCESLSTPK
eukprot:SAG25_NODE_12583_length_278_cov_0.569832_1_plen_54_part_10